VSKHTIQLGRRGHSPGHCHNCAQARVEVTVAGAKDKKAAVAIVQALATLTEGRPLVVQSPMEGVTLRLVLDHNLIDTRTVKLLALHQSGEHKLPETRAS
jgi:hypothetical protein